MYQGSFVALITPFQKGGVDDKKLSELVDWQIAQGTSGIVPVGTTGESATLSYEEHAHVIDVVVKAAKGRVPVIAGTGSNSTDEAIHLTAEAQKLGVDGVLLVNPYYNKPTQDGLFAHFSAIAKAVNVPIVLYNIPSRTGVNLNVDTMVRLVQAHSNIVGVKESTGSMDQATEIFQKAGAKLTVLSGDDSLTLPLMSMGATGVISVAANLVPRAIADLCAAWKKGDIADAQKRHVQLFPLIKALFIETNPAPIKAAMKEAGLLDDESLRLPMVPISEASRTALRAAMKAFGVH